MNKFKVDTIYNYGDILESISNDKDLYYDEYGNLSIGDSFIVVKDKESFFIVSFVLISISSLEYKYKCIYSDYE